MMKLYVNSYNILVVTSMLWSGQKKWLSHILRVKVRFSESNSKYTRETTRWIDITCLGNIMHAPLPGSLSYFPLDMFFKGISRQLRPKDNILDDSLGNPN